MSIKYPNLASGFPEDIVKRCEEKMEEGDEEFKEFLVELCHEYFKIANYSFWLGLSSSASSLMNEFTLENFEKAMVNDKQRK